LFGDGRWWVTVLRSVTLNTAIELLNASFGQSTDDCSQLVHTYGENRHRVGIESPLSRVWVMALWRQSVI